MTPKQAEAFLKALYPEGEHGYLQSHARTYFEALLGAGAVPTGIPTSRHQAEAIDLCMVLGKTLIDIGNVMMSSAMDAKSK